jgi:hypothetical protein
MKRKLSAADRPEFRRDVAKMMKGLDSKVAPSLSSDMVILCLRAEDFRMADNVIWELEANKSAVRPDIQCNGCKSVVAMSNHAYENYSKMDKKPRICCTRCIESLTNQE